LKNELLRKQKFHKETRRLRRRRQNRTAKSRWYHILYLPDTVKRAEGTGIQTFKTGPLKIVHYNVNKTLVWEKLIASLNHNPPIYLPCSL